MSRKGSDNELFEAASGETRDTPIDVNGFIKRPWAKKSTAISKSATKEKSGEYTIDHYNNNANAECSDRLVWAPVYVTHFSRRSPRVLLQGPIQKQKPTASSQDPEKQLLTIAPAYRNTQESFFRYSDIQEMKALAKLKTKAKTDSK